jgi:thioesterase domain-containing protein
VVGQSHVLALHNLNLTFFLGWSLGGLIAIQAARLLSNGPELKVVGIVMIDSTFPIEGQYTKARRIAFMAETSTRPYMAEKTRKCMNEAQLQSREWKPPVWRSSATEILDGHSQTTKWQINDSTTPLCPPAILIRAIDEGPKDSPDSSKASASETSKNGETQALGFDRYQNFNLRYVVDTPGDHFSIFNHENVSMKLLTLTEPRDLILVQVKELSKKLKEACDMLAMKSQNI